MKTADPYISIITPIVNSWDFFSETYEALKGSHFRLYEWIIIFEKNTDQQLIAYFTKQVTLDSRIRIIQSEANDLYTLCNTGIKNSNSSFLFFLKLGELIKPTFLDKALLFLEGNKDFDFVGSYFTYLRKDQQDPININYDNIIGLESESHPGGFMFRRETLQTFEFGENELKPQRGGYSFWKMLASRFKRKYIIPEYLYRCLSNSEKIQNNLGEAENKIELRKDSFIRKELSEHNFGYIVPAIEIEFQKVEALEKRIICFFPWLQVGGADQFNLQLLRGLKSKGWEITIVTTNESENSLEGEFAIISEDIFHLANLGSVETYSAYIHYLIRSRQPVKAFLSNSMHVYYLLPWIKLQFPDLALIDYVHCEDVNWYNGGYPFFSASYSGILDKTFVTSNQLRNWCISKGGDPNKIEVCYINVDTDQIKKKEIKDNILRNRHGISKAEIVLLYVARLTAQKQPLVLTEVLAELKKRKLNFKCIIIGDGPEKKILVERLNSYRLTERVIYIGEQSNEVVLQYMDEADIFFLPSLYEGIALSIFEAMAKELAIVGADTGGQGELVTKECGYLLTKKNNEHEVLGYADILQRLIEDKALIQEMGKNGRERVKTNFRLEDMVTRMDQSLLKVRSLVPETSAIQRSYLLLLNRMQELEIKNQDLRSLTNNRVMKFLSRYNSVYQKTKKVYSSLKNFLKLNP